MELELRHLRTVRAIADTGSLTKAAATLGLAQPALSAQLRRIEKALGGTLFERDHTGARATPLGELVLERARVVLPAVSELQAEAVRFANATGPLERFRLGGTHGPLLGGLVDRIATAHPAAPVSTYTAWSVDEIAALTIDGRLDFALIGTCGESPPPLAERLVWEVVGVDPVFVMLPENHPLAAEEELDLASLADQCWADVPGDGCFADCFATACARAGFTPVSVYETDTSSVVHLVQVGRAIGLCRATFPPVPGVVVRPLSGAPLSWRHLLGWHPRSPAADTAAVAVAGQTRAAYAEAVSRSPVYARWLAKNPRFGLVS
ncbi:LysR family transcriptional regulator [Streptomyces sp. CB00316]|uniref:LysR family transcriptional regulator n=1 Tax=unclassified Streptomyces TaxID=2593676 RepID=UPI00093A64D7|nr:MULTISPECIES: LysR family transcriptional regulator [unclassified Streptomyces]MBT2380894.1 LysR family transcriptional regulator [Streptomyces sp. ISL-111]MBT2429695.1 LysR family transcriptional regulator [Streptomyces sp. ISL-112]MBT2464812.1 LysR family transcriptional regulator [Streptomyces sp. ISL-63]OKJ21430.1 LysR family transcriptional regulator [Streptomyces sp. CB00316]